ncbi:hypothetical protein ACHAWF_004581 [Thalassiosira exigua]
MLEELRFSFVPGEEAATTPIWDWRLEQCRRFKAEHGHLNIGKKDKVMGPWALRMRGLYQRKVEGEWELLTIEEKAKLQTLEALNFAFDGSFDVFLRKLAEFKKSNGHCRVPSTYRADPPLASWVERIRVENSRIGAAGVGTSTLLSRDRLRKLRDVGFHFERMQTIVPWEEHFQKLVVYREEHGKDPPLSQKGLGGWVRRQRVLYSYKQRAEGPRKHLLTDDREEKLRNVGFSFFAEKKPGTSPTATKKKGPHTTWDERLAEFVRWKERHGHPYVPTSASDEDKSLGLWVAAQRGAHKAFQRAENDSRYPSFNAEKVQKLTDAGFAFDGSHQSEERKAATEAAALLKWEERLAEFVQWKERHGHPYVPTNARGLGYWVGAQRKAYKAHKGAEKKSRFPSFNAEKALKLENAGFAFDASHMRGPVFDGLLVQKKPKEDKSVGEDVATRAPWHTPESPPLESTSD